MMPLKRHPALQDLSRDHQRFLLEARHIRWFVEGDERAAPLDGVIDSLLTFWEIHGRPHLQEEEEVIYVLYAEYAPHGRQHIAPMLADHDWLRDKMNDLSRARHYEDPAPLLQSLADRIVSHVRHEERIIYEHIQSTLTVEQLQVLAEQSLAFRKEHRSPDAIGPAQGHRSEHSDT